MTDICICGHTSDLHICTDNQCPRSYAHTEDCSACDDCPDYIERPLESGFHFSHEYTSDVVRHETTGLGARELDFSDIMAAYSDSKGNRYRAGMKWDWRNKF